MYRLGPRWGLHNAQSCAAWSPGNQLRFDVHQMAVPVLGQAIHTITQVKRPDCKTHSGVRSGVSLRTYAASEGSAAPVHSQEGESSSSAESAEDVEIREGSGSNGTTTETGGLQLRSGVAMLPHPAKVHKGGEDAYFVADNGLALGVADGVGAWADIGVDAGRYSKLLMRFAKERANELRPPVTKQSPLDILNYAYERVDVPGSCTACILVLNGRQLIGRNLGDSGFVVLREWRPVFESDAQLHGFNFPFQLTGPTPAHEAKSDVPKKDMPSDAKELQFELQVGDVIVAGSDGLFDNLYPKDLALVVEQEMRLKRQPAEVATYLAHVAQQLASKTEYMSPFAQSAFNAGFNYIGGKMDDITVVVSVVEQKAEVGGQQAGAAKGTPSASGKEAGGGGDEGQTPPPGGEQSKL